MVEQSPIDPADWVTLWQSELAALAVDRECHERVTALAQGFAQAGASPGDAAIGRPGPDAAPGPSAAGPASGLGGELDELRRRIAELERAARPTA